MTRARRFLGTLGAVALAALFLQSCGKKESLVVVALTASPADSTISSVVIDVASVSKTFNGVPGLGATPYSLGVYVPDSVTGDVLVAVQGHTSSGEGCYSGTGHVTIASAGTTADVVIALTLKKSCASSTGAAGSSPGTAGTQGSAGADGGAAGAGTAGTQGAAGAGGTGAAGTGAAGTGAAGTGAAGTGQVVGPPSLAKCTEYSHIGALACTPSTVNGGDTHLWDVTFSPDGKTLVTSGDDGVIKLWKMTGAVPSPSGMISTSGQSYVAFSPDGKYLVEGSWFGELNVYDAATLALVGSFTGHNNDVEAVAFTADGKSIWSFDADGVLTRHEIGAGAAPTASQTTASCGYMMALSPVMSTGTQWIAVGYDIGTGDIANVGITNPTPTPITVTQTGSVFAMSFSRDGTQLAAGGEDGVLSFWSIPPANSTPTSPTITILDGVGAPMPMRAVKYSPDGKTLGIAVGLSTATWKLATYDAATRKVKNTKVPTYEPLSVAWSPSGTILVAGEISCGKFIVCSDN